MKERFSADGSQKLWLQASKEALEAAGFKNLEYDANTSTLTGNLDGPISVRVTPMEDGKTSLELDSDSATDLSTYKQNVAKAFQILQRKYPNEAKTEPLGQTPKNLRPDTTERFQTAFDDQGNPNDFDLDNDVFVIPGSVLNTGVIGGPDVLDHSTPNIDTTGYSSIYDNPSYNNEAGGSVETIPTQSGSVEKVKNQPTSKVKGARPWYQTEWFTLLCLILIPPLGIFLMWYNKVYDTTLRKYLTAFFCVYTVLWAWLLILPFLPRDTTITADDTEYYEDSDLSAVEQVESYWGEAAVQDFVLQMPDLMTTYEQMYINESLYTEAGLQTARDILPQVQDLCSRVLSVPEVGEASAAYPLQFKVNECAESFSSDAALYLRMINDDDMQGLNNNSNLWNDAESLYYEIEYTYQRALQSAYEADGLTYIPDNSTTNNNTTVPNLTDNQTTTPDYGSTDTNNNNNNNNAGTNNNNTTQPSQNTQQPATNNTQNQNNQQQQTTTTTVVTETVEETITYE